MGRLADLDGAGVGKARRRAVAAAPRPRADRSGVDRAGRGARSRGASARRTRTRLEAANAAARDAKSRADAAFEAAQKNAAPPPARGGRPQGDRSAWPRASPRWSRPRNRREERIAAHGGRRQRPGASPSSRSRCAPRSSAASRSRRSSPPCRPLGADAKALGAARAVRRDRRAARRGARARTFAAHRRDAERGGRRRRAKAASSTGCKQNAERLVRIRPINEAPGDDAATVIGARRREGGARRSCRRARRTRRACRPRCARRRKRGSRAPRRSDAALAAARELADDAVGALGESHERIARMIRVVVVPRRRGADRARRGVARRPARTGRDHLARLSRRHLGDGRDRWRSASSRSRR